MACSRVNFSFTFTYKCQKCLSKLNNIFWNLKLFTSWDSVKEQRSMWTHSKNFLGMRKTWPWRTPPTQVPYVGVQQSGGEVRHSFEKKFLCHVLWAHRSSSLSAECTVCAARFTACAFFTLWLPKIKSGAYRRCPSLLRGETEWVGEHTRPTKKQDSYPGPEHWSLALSPARLWCEIWGFHSVDVFICSGLQCKGTGLMISDVSNEPTVFIFKGWARHQ
jgi:hypothetical protein